MTQEQARKALEDAAVEYVKTVDQPRWQNIYMAVLDAVLPVVDPSTHPIRPGEPG